MNKLIKKQLENTKNVKIIFSDTDTEVYIPRTTRIDKLEKGKSYIIEVEDFVLKPNSNSTFTSNWNQGRVPKNKEYYVEVVDVIGNVYKFNGLALNDQTDNWYGFIPREGFKVKEII